MKSENKEITEYNPDDNNNNNSSNGNKQPVKERKINLPNKLTIFRIILVPFFMAFILIPENDVFHGTWIRIFAAALILIAILTDWFDGIIARKFKLVTDFGRLMDPIADKFLVVGALIAIVASPYFDGIRLFAVCATSVVFFRELAVTSVRLIANTADGNVISANFIGKFKALSQYVCILTILLEDVVLTQSLGTPEYLFSYITMGIMTVMTVYSGFVYFKAYWKYIDPTK